MFKIDCDNNITIKAGDTGFLNFRCANHRLGKGDSVILTVHNKEEHGNLFAVQTNEFNEAGVASLDISAENSAKKPGVYDYSIRVITSNGIDDTVIESKFNII